VRLEVKEPVVPAAATIVFAVVGLLVVAYTTPRWVMVAPPSEVTFPPVLAVVIVTADAAVVDTVGADTDEPVPESVTA
jgi:hypothetical protein